MTKVLIVLTLPGPVRMQYFNHLKQHFPGIKLDMVDHHSKVDPYIAAAEVLVTFGPHVANHVFEKAKRSEEHTSELQSLTNIVCRLLLEHQTSRAAKTRPTLSVH